MRVNRRIRVPRVLVIDESGNRLGEFLTEDAIRLAGERGLDLVEVAPGARPPVCRIADYGRMKYDKKKRDAAARRNQVHVQIKEVKLRPKTDEHDIGVKVRLSRGFLEDGNKVKVTVRFRGREMAHRDIGASQCMRLAKECEDLGTIESHPRMDGRQMFMIIAPLRRPTPKRARGDEQPDDQANGQSPPSSEEAEAIADAIADAALAAAEGAGTGEEEEQAEDDE